MTFIYIQLKDFQLYCIFVLYIFFFSFTINPDQITDQILSTPLPPHAGVHPLCNLKNHSFPGPSSYLGSLPFPLYICCPFLDVLSCFVTLHGAQYLFGSAACPILYFTKVKQQRWPAEELHVSFIFVGKVKAGREATSAVPQRKMDLFLEYQSSTSFPRYGI